MVTILMMPAKMANLGLLKIKLFSNEVYDVTNKSLSCDSSYIVDVVI